MKWALQRTQDHANPGRIRGKIVQRSLEREYKCNERENWDLLETNLEDDEISLTHYVSQMVGIENLDQFLSRNGFTDTTVFWWDQALIVLNEHAPATRAHEPIRRALHVLRKSSHLQWINKGWGLWYDPKYQLNQELKENGCSWFNVWSKQMTTTDHTLPLQPWGPIFIGYILAREWKFGLPDWRSAIQSMNMIGETCPLSRFTSQTVHLTICQVAFGGGGYLTVNLGRRAQEVEHIGDSCWHGAVRQWQQSRQRHLYETILVSAPAWSGNIRTSCHHEAMIVAAAAPNLSHVCYEVMFQTIMIKDRKITMVQQSTVMITYITTIKLRLIWIGVTLIRAIKEYYKNTLYNYLKRSWSLNWGLY